MSSNTAFLKKLLWISLFCFMDIFVLSSWWGWPTVTHSLLSSQDIHILVLYLFSFVSIYHGLEKSTDTPKEKNIYTYVKAWYNIIVLQHCCDLSVVKKLSWCVALPYHLLFASYIVPESELLLLLLNYVISVLKVCKAVGDAGTDMYNGSYS